MLEMGREGIGNSWGLLEGRMYLLGFWEWRFMGVDLVGFLFIYFLCRRFFI